MKDSKSIRLDLETIRKGKLKIWIGITTLGIFVILIITRLDIYKVKGNSMFNTIHNGDVILIWKNLKSPNVFKKNDIVLFQKEINDEVVLFLKRITAVPNDSIKAKFDELIMNGKAYPHDEIYYIMSDDLETINGEYLQYLMDQSAGCEEANKVEARILSNSTKLRVPTECYFLTGDNPYESMDSRFWGFIHEDQIIGKIIAVF